MAQTYIAYITSVTTHPQIHCNMYTLKNIFLFSLYTIPKKYCIISVKLKYCLTQTHDTGGISIWTQKQKIK